MSILPIKKTKLKSPLLVEEGRILSTKGLEQGKGHQCGQDEEKSALSHPLDILPALLQFFLKDCSQKCRKVCSKLREKLEGEWMHHDAMWKFQTNPSSFSHVEVIPVYWHNSHHSSHVTVSGWTLCTSGKRCIEMGTTFMCLLEYTGFLWETLSLQVLV